MPHAVTHIAVSAAKAMAQLMWPRSQRSRPACSSVFRWSAELAEVVFDLKNPFTRSNNQPSAQLLCNLISIWDLLSTYAGFPGIPGQVAGRPGQILYRLSILRLMNRNFVLNPDSD